MPLKQRPTWRILKRLLPYLKRYRSRVSLAIAALLMAAATMLALPVAFRWLIDKGFATVNQGAPAADVNFVFIGLFALAVLLAASTAIRFYCVAWLGERVAVDLRNDVYSHVLKQDFGFFETLKTGEILSRLSTDTTLVQTLIGSSLSLGLRNMLLLFGALIMMIYTSPSLAIIIIGLLLLVVLPILIFGRRVRKLSRTSQARLADTGAVAGETLNAIQVVQAYVREAMESARYTASTELAFESAIRTKKSRALLTLVGIVLIYAAIVMVLWAGANSVVNGNMSAGLLIQFIMYAVLVAAAAGAISEVLGEVQTAAGATERLIELLEAAPDIRSGGYLQKPQQDTTAARFGATRFGTTRLGTTRLGTTISFENVAFSYPSRPSQRALCGLSFTVNRGETVALVGASGAGKTTLLQLLLRFYDPQQGSIFIDQIALADYQLQQLRQSIALVSQDSVIFSENALNNIRYGNLEASEQQVRDAAKAAQAHDFIERLPQGYHTYLGARGIRLSGGQRQRICIARALLKNPPLLLLDEATSALDADSERKVQLALESAINGRTTIVIAHRLATIVNADRILVLDNGKLVESGSHEELTKSSGIYANLATMQFRGSF